jgi:AsmA protein
MLKALKIFGIVIGVIIVLIVAAVLIIPQVINPNDYRDDIEAAVANNTDRTLTINGDIKLSLFPWLGVTVGKATLGNAPGFDDRPFATIDSMEVRVRLLSLIGSRPEIGTLKLDGLTLALARNAKGRTNWQDLLPSKNGPRHNKGEASKGGIGDFTIDAIKLRDATINWRDAESGQHYRVRDANVTLGKIRAGKPFSLKASFTFDREKPVLHANFGLKTTATVYPDAKQYRLKNGSVEVAARGAELPTQPTHLKASWQSLQLDQNAGTFKLKDLNLNALDIKAHAVLQGSGLNGTPKISGILVVPDFSPRDLLAKMGRQVQPQDSSVLRHASLSADIEASGKQAALKNLKATLDDTQVSGQLGMPDFDTHALAFNLVVDKLDADRYLPAGREHAAKQVSLAALNDIKLPGNRLRGLNLNGNLKIGSFKLLNLKASDVAARVQAANGVVHLKPVTAKLYGGTYQGAVTTAAATGNAMKLDTSQTLDGIHFGPLLNDLLGKEILSGTASLNIAFDGTGKTVGALEKTLDGKLGFKVEHGAIEGIDLWGAIDRAYALLKKKKPPKETGRKRTEFVNMSGSGKIDKGVVHNDDFKAQLPFMHLNGQGTINLVQQKVDYKLKAGILKVPTKKVPGALKKLKGQTIPIHIEGSFSSLTSFPSLRHALEDRVKDKAKSRLDKKKSELKNKLKGKLKGKLQGLMHSTESTSG